MKNFFYTCCVLLGLISLTNCTKENVAEPDKEQTPENSALTATIEDISTKTNLDGVNVTWKKDDRIAIQLSNKHRDNLKTNSNPTKPYATTFGVYKLADVAADKKVGQFIFDKENKDSKEEIDGDEEFFAFYPASFCSVHKDNGYFYFEFLQTQKYEDVIGGKFPLPMYGIGKDKKIDFKYAGAVIKLKVWSHEPNIKIKSCVITADGGLSKKAFTNINKNGNNEYYWEDLQPSYDVNYLIVKMEKPIELSIDEQHPTEIPIVVPLARERKLTNLKFSINCTTDEGKLAGCELKKTSGLTVTPGTIVNFSTKEIKLDYVRMYIDGVEGEYDINEIKKAKESFRLTAPDNITLHKDTFKQIIEATKSLNNTNNVVNIDNLNSLENTESSNHQIIVDLSGITADDDIKTINTPDNDKGGFCGSNSKENGIKNISELYLPKGITTIKDRAFANSDYKKIVLPSTLTQFLYAPGRGSNGLKWEVAEGNEVFWTDNEGALYGNIEKSKTLVALNGGSGETYRIQEGTEKIGSWSMYDNSVLTTLVLPESINSIGGDGLSSTPSLTTIIVYGAPVFNKNSGNNNVGKKGELKTLYVADKYHQQYMDKLKENPNWSKNNWQVLKLSEYKGTIPAENPAPGQGSQN